MAGLVNSLYIQIDRKGPPTRNSIGLAIRYTTVFLLSTMPLQVWETIGYPSPAMKNDRCLIARTLRLPSSLV